MKILIIGGTRYFGYHITKRLLRDGHQITLFNRGRTPDDFGKGITRIRGDRNDSKAFIERLRKEKFDVAVDMIAFKAEDSLSAIESFLDNIGHFFHISSAAVYIITQDFPCPLEEEDFGRPLYSKRREKDELWDYGYHKRKCEEVLLEAYQRRGFPVTILRLPVVIGERDYTLRAYSYFLRIQDGKPMILPDSGLNVFTHIYQDDVVKTLASNLLNSSSMGQAYNLAQEEIITLRAFVLKAAEILETDVELVDIPTDVLNKTQLGTAFSPFFSRRPFVLDVQKARRELNYSSTPFDAWMRKTIQWFLEDYNGGPPENYILRKRELGLVEKYKKALQSLL